MTIQKKIPEDMALLMSMVSDSEAVPEIYRPGPYWLNNTKKSEKEIRKFGLNDFRGSGNSIGASFSDSALIDIRGEYNQGVRSVLSWACRHVFPISKIFDAQVSLSKAIFNQAILFKNQVANQSAIVRQLVNEFDIPDDSIRGGCLDFCEIGGKLISNHYLNLLETHLNIKKHINFESARSFFEIGGGFGVNVHLLIENYKNLKKIVYLDIAPNLYVGTQYLKSFFGGSVRSYLETRDLRSIEFHVGDELEILCILPHQIERLNLSIDIFQNSHSFVEMPKNIVSNYARHINRVTNSEGSAIGLVSYDGFNLESTFHPDALPELFGRTFKKYEAPTLWDPERSNYYYVSA